MELPGKKGACMTLRNNDDEINNWERILTLKPHWYYTWGLNHRLDDHPDDIDIEYIPMIWGQAFNKPKKNRNLQQDLETILDSGKIKKILTFNEPDKKKQSNMSVETAIEIWSKLEQYNIPLISPACAGPPNNEWMTNFMEQCTTNNYRVDAISIHMYPGPDVNHFKNKVQEYYESYNSEKSIILSEFAVADWNAQNVEDNVFTQEKVLNFMKQVIPWLERTEYILGYSWFSFKIDRPQGTSSALFNADGSLTACGKYYSTVSSENPDGDQSITVENYNEEL